MMSRFAARRTWWPACSKPAPPHHPPPASPWSRLFSSLPTTSPAKRGIFSLDAVSDPTNRVQIYVSRSRDPYLNLSIEHFLLENTPPDSVVLLTYVNRPCVVVGRNQNPWLEVNLGLVRRAPPPPPPSTPGRAGEEEYEGEEEDIGSMTLSADGDSVVDLVRRRSGGGTVFHDLGNCNYSVLCPPADFDRDKHAEMVARALRGLIGATTTTTTTPAASSTVRVNERHDIVLDVDVDVEVAAGGDASKRTPKTETQRQQKKKQTFKISGSAYKLTRRRALHHGTCLLASPNLAAASRLLRSPAEPYIRARGVASVRSPMRNVGGGVLPSQFQRAVAGEFRALYGGVGGGGGGGDAITTTTQPGIAVGAREAMSIPGLVKGYEELRSKEWLYTQTPQFTLSTHPTADDPRPRPALPSYLPPGFRAEITVRHGQITAVSGGGGGGGDGLLLPESLVSTYLHEVDDWEARVGDARVGRWLNELLGVGFYSC